jgi:formate hydrogenlyase subunit 3/multisubunit Na+/H+ antiporter MnhD subunit
MSNIISNLVVVMLSLYGLGALLALIFASSPRLANLVPNSITAFAALTGICASTVQLLSNIDRVYLGNVITSVPYISLEMSIDRLSAFFLLALSVLVLAVSIYSMGYITHYYQKRNVAIFNFLVNSFILAMIGVLIAENMIAFFACWELMSVVSYFLVIYEADDARDQKAGIIYLIMTHLTSAFLLIALGLIYKCTGSLSINTSLTSAPVWIKNLLFISFLISFGTKAGIIPLHIWLPYAHPAAPSNISALMSGIMIKMAIYGFIRFVFEMLGAEFQWWGVTILIAGVITTILGVAYTLVESNIKRLLAYCSIENIGIILIGLGVSFLAYSTGEMSLSALALMAALFHLLNHTIVKGALFMGAGAILHSTHTKDMENLGGLLKKMPFTGLFLLASSLAISAIPPFNGFVSEWLTFQSLFVHIATAGIGIKVLLILTAAALAMAGTLAATSFVKFFGISFLGRPRTENALNAKEASKPMLFGMGLLVILSLILGILPQGVIGLLNQVVMNTTGVSIAHVLNGKSVMLVYPLNVDHSGIAPMMILVIGIILIILTVLILKVLGPQVKGRKYNTWDCGYSQLGPRMQYSATGFSKPLRIIFRSIYRPNRQLQVETGASPYFPKSMKYVVTTESVFEKYFYQPVTRALTSFARRFRMVIQTGSIHHYLIYIFVTILILLLYFRCFA